VIGVLRGTDRDELVVTPSDRTEGP